ncbi:efflux RND transporter permease subunit [Caulobacter segnis]
MFIALLLAGVFSYFQLPIKQYPNVQLPMVSVTVTESEQPRPPRSETQITRQVEDAVAGVSNVENVQSVDHPGRLDHEYHLQDGRGPAEEDRRGPHQDRAGRAQLPRDIDAPTVQRVEIDSAPIMTYAVSVEGLIRRSAVVVRRRHHRPRPAGRARRRPDHPVWAASNREISTYWSIPTS